MALTRYDKRWKAEEEGEWMKKAKEEGLKMTDNGYAEWDYNNDNNVMSFMVIVVVAMK